MATIAQIVKEGEGKAGSSGAWEAYTIDDICELWHYSHRMLTWLKNDPTDEAYLDYSIGWGSVSDQGGMNTAFAALGLKLYYSRAGGAEITELEQPNFKWGVSA